MSALFPEVTYEWMDCFVHFINLRICGRGACFSTQYENVGMRQQCRFLGCSFCSDVCNMRSFNARLRPSFTSKMFRIGHVNGKLALWQPGSLARLRCCSPHALDHKKINASPFTPNAGPGPDGAAMRARARMLSNLLNPTYAKSCL